MKKFLYILFLFLFLVSCEKLTLLQTQTKDDLKLFDEVLFPYLLTSFMWHIPSSTNNNSPYATTDEMNGASIEWIRFRSAMGKNSGDAIDFCLAVKHLEQRIELSLIQIPFGQVCDNEKNIILYKIKNLKRVLWHWPKSEQLKTKKSGVLEFEWIEDAKWYKQSFEYDLPYFPINHQHLSWGKTWRNQKPFSHLEWINPSNSIFIKLTDSNFNMVKLTKIPHQISKDWQKAQVCFAVNDQCQPTMLEQCHLCEKSYFTLYNTKCSSHGTSYCGEIECGKKNQPACYLGQHHVKQDDFKGCGPFTEEWFCHAGLEIKCTKDGAVCY